MSEATITSETRGKVGIITLNRPKAMNALNGQLITEMNAALDRFDADSNIGCIILTGSEKAFAAGADIREMKDKTFAEVTQEDFLWDWDHIGTIRKPIIAAVAGYCLGGGFEFALACGFHHRGGEREIRAAGSDTGHHPRRWRHAAPGTHRWQGQVHGDDPDRPHDGCDRGRAAGHRGPRRAGRKAHG
jgi:1,4-dihydroxy-2-naphthoyl-CoA synthase